MAAKNDHNLLTDAKLAWACRRGMLELDVLLGNFLKNHYALLSDAEKNRFISLLTFEDAQLFRWFFNEEPPPAELSQLIELIKFHNKNVT